MDAFAKLADPGFAQDVGFILGGYSAAAAGDLAVDQITDRDVPREVFGVATVVGAEYAPYVGGMTMRHMQLGGAAHTALAAADRLNVRENIEEAI